MPRKRSYLTVTDQFCGAGGSSLGAVAAGLEVRMALNHWKLAIETHNTNFPNTDHDCTNISACDPRRYPSTDFLITSPECTTHSPAGGNKHRKKPQRDLFIPSDSDPATQRSRATMFDVVRFAEYHDYRAIIVENVVEVTRWALFWDWWKMMERLGYVGELVSLNSQFAHPTPQSRDRVYIVWTKAGNRRPDLRISPLAPCMKCGDVEARQSWKNGRRVGKYGDRNQYIYTCPRCHAIVTPYYYCALNSLDFSIPATRIGDRAVPLKERTRARVLFGYRKYGTRALQVTVNNTSGVSCRVRGIDEALFTMTTSNTTAVVSPPGGTPFLYVARENVKARGIDQPSPALVASANQVGIVQPAALIKLVGDRPVRSLDETHTTQTTGADQNLLVSKSPYLIQYYGTNNASAVDEAVPSVTTKDRHGVVTPSSDAIDIDSWYFRMMVAREIGATMAFPPTYVVLGTNGQQIKQYGNAVTPPAMALLIQRVVQSITGERAA